MSDKQTFSEYFDRNLQLQFRKLRVVANWRIFESLYPIRALFLYRKFKRIEAKIIEQINENNRKGYWI